MTDAEMTRRTPVMRWVPVTDERGRTRMEARWVLLDAEPPGDLRPADPRPGHAA